MFIGIALIVITVLVSIAAFNNQELYNQLILWPRVMHGPEQYYRLLTAGFIHADWNHLIFNMFALYMFSDAVQAFIPSPGIYVLLYLCGIITSSLPSFLKNRHNSYYRSLGASGGVAALIFYSIYFMPWSQIGIIFIPFIRIPAILFAVLYLLYSAYMSRRGTSNINHDAHFWGAVFGFLFAVVIDPTHGQLFIWQIAHPMH